MQLMATAHFFFFIIVAILITVFHWNDLLATPDYLTSSEQWVPFLALYVAAFISRVSLIRVSAKGYESVNDAFYMVSLFMGQFGVFLLIVLLSIFPAEIIIRYKHIKHYGWYRVSRSILSNLSILIFPGYVAYLVYLLWGQSNRLVFFLMFFIFVAINKFLTSVGIRFLDEKFSLKAIVSHFRQSWHLDAAVSAMLGYLLLISYFIDARLMLLTVPLFFVVQVFLARFIRNKNLKSILNLSKDDDEN